MWEESSQRNRHFYKSLANRHHAVCRTPTPLRLDRSCVSRSVCRFKKMLPRSACHALQLQPTSLSKGRENVRDHGLQYVAQQSLDTDRSVVSVSNARGSEAKW